MTLQLVRVPFLVYLYVADIRKVKQWASFTAITLLLAIPTSENGPFLMRLTQGAETR